MLRALVVLLVASIAGESAAAVATLGPGCRRSVDLPFLESIRVPQQCPLRLELSPPLEVSGETIDKELTLGQRTASYSILFYASWCPFSSNFRPMFDALSSMFPQIRHLAVEESSAMPSLFSRYGIHGFPAVLLINGTSVIRYQGLKDLDSLVNFYKETTGLEPLVYFDIDQQGSSGNMRSLLPRDRSLREVVNDEPLVVLGVIFIFLKIIAPFIPVAFFHIRVFWVLRARNLSLGIFRGSNQLLERALDVLDVKKLWSKLRLCNKTRGFRKGASNARVWASSITSVSLGESSSSRLASLES